jgi:hypothetical protein
MTTTQRKNKKSIVGVVFVGKLLEKAFFVGGLFDKSPPTPLQKLP